MSVNAIMPLCKANYAFICSSERTMLTDVLPAYSASNANLMAFTEALVLHTGILYGIIIITFSHYISTGPES